jgi:cell division protein ZapE
VTRTHDAPADPLSLETLLESLRGRPDLASLVNDLVPPPRFAPKRFANYHPRHPTQAEATERLRTVGVMLRGREHPRLARGFFRRRRPAGEVVGIYLDGGFGVGKTHLLAALWHEAPEPKAYLSFDELMYLIGMAGPAAAAGSLGSSSLIAIDEWELDDPGNLKLAVAFLRALPKERPFLAVTSNTLPIELGAGRFSQKDFRSEIDELARGFEVVRIAGEDYRHRHFDVEGGGSIFAGSAEFAALAAGRPAAALVVPFAHLLSGLGSVHPIRYREAARRLDLLLVEDIEPIPSLPAALRWVHFIDSIYDARVPFSATARIPLGRVFAAGWIAGPFGKKLSRCLSRMEEMLGERPRAADGDPPGGPAAALNRGRAIGGRA